MMLKETINTIYLTGIALLNLKSIDEPMVHQNINLSAFTVCVEHNIMKEGIFNLGGLSSSLIFKGAEFFRKEEKEKARQYVNIGSMHVEIPRVFPT